MGTPVQTKYFTPGIVRDPPDTNRFDVIHEDSIPRQRSLCEKMGTLFKKFICCKRAPNYSPTETSPGSRSTNRVTDSTPLSYGSPIPRDESPSTSPINFDGSPSRTFSRLVFEEDESTRPLSAPARSSSPSCLRPALAAHPRTFLDPPLSTGSIINYGRTNYIESKLSHEELSIVHGELSTFQTHDCAYMYYRVNIKDLDLIDQITFIQSLHNRYPLQNYARLRGQRSLPFVALIRVTIYPEHDYTASACFEVKRTNELVVIHSPTQMKHSFNLTFEECDNLYLSTDLPGLPICCEQNPIFVHNPDHFIS